MLQDTHVERLDRHPLARGAVTSLLVACHYYGTPATPATPATPQPTSSPYASHVELGSIAGVHTFATDNSLGAASSGDSLRDSAMFGVRAGVYFAGRFGVEAQLAVVPTEAREMVYDVWVLLAEANLIYEPLGDTGESRLVPLLYAGAVLYDVASSDGAPAGGITSGTVLAPDVGVGAKYLVGNGWGLRADASVLFPSSVGGGVTQDYEVILSIYRSYGGPAPAPAPL